MVDMIGEYWIEKLFVDNFFFTNLTIFL